MPGLPLIIVLPHLLSSNLHFRKSLPHHQTPSEVHSDPLETKTTRPYPLNIHSYPPNYLTSLPISYVHRLTNQSTHSHLTLQYLFEKYYPNLLRAAYDSVKIINLIPTTAYFPLNHQPMNTLKLLPLPPPHPPPTPTTIPGESHKTHVDSTPYTSQNTSNIQGGP